jgi:Carboxypeptidase regulatory-like domain
MRTKACCIFQFLFLILVGSGRILAQATSSGNIIGIVTDTTGAAIPSATVTAVNKGTNAQRITTSNSTGQYRFDLLPVGGALCHHSGKPSAFQFVLSSF